MTDQFLYRYYGASGERLYNGRSNDWSRRLREHSRTDAWFPEIRSVTVEPHPDLASVVAAETASIRAERPRYNVLNNRPGIVAGDLTPGRVWTADQVLVMMAVAFVAGIIVYKTAEYLAGRYEQWQADRAEFREWKHARALEAELTEPAPGPVEPVTVEPAVIAPEPEPVDRRPAPVFTARPPAPLVITAPVPMVMTWLQGTRTTPVVTLPGSPLAAIMVAAFMCFCQSPEAKRAMNKLLTARSAQPARK